MSGAAATRPGLLAVWNDIAAEDEAEYNAWYEAEHIPERLALPGFLGARRYRDADAARRYAALYDTDSLAALGSPAYLERLAHPTPRTRAVMPRFRNMARAVCEVQGDHGSAGAPRAALACLMLPADGALADAQRALAAEAPALLAGALRRLRLAAPDAGATRAPNPEARLRAQPDALPAPFVLLEGDDEAGVRAAGEHLQTALGAPAPARVFRLILARAAGG